MFFKKKHTKDLEDIKKSVNSIQKNTLKKDDILKNSIEFKSFILDGIEESFQDPMNRLLDEIITVRDRLTDVTIKLRDLETDINNIKKDKNA